MQTILYPAREQWPGLCRRNTPSDDEISEAVAAIVAKVREGGDAALRRLACQFDGAGADDPLLLTPAERERIAARTPETVRQAIRHAADNIRRFHEAQRRDDVDIETQPGVRCVQRSVPIGSVGLYVPGGSAPLFSTVLMLAIPAKAAGCRHITLATPVGAGRKVAPEIVFAANLCQVDEILCCGGAQAIAALAYGTETVRAVDKIFGPGNRYVMKAKQLVSRHTAIDMPAGPSEVLVMADGTAHPDYVAADMLSQAEHGPDSQALCVCTGEAMARDVEAEVRRQADKLPRRASVEGSLSKSRIIVLRDVAEMTAFAESYAPEHLIIATAEPWDVAAGITTAGSVFVGHYSPESAGDYASGTNHTLPTGGWARSTSGVSLDSFCRRMTIQELTKDGLAALAPTIVAMARAEGLDAHAEAALVRTR